MANPSPIHSRHEGLDAQFIAFGEIPVVAMHDVVETEYGRLRNRVAIMDCPHRALIELTGKDRRDFLHRTLSNDCNGLIAGNGRRAFLLTAKGKIIADLIVLHGEEHTWIDVDTVDAATLVGEFDKLIFTEDVQVRDVSARQHRLSLHGPNAFDLLDELSAASLHADGVTWSHQSVTLSGIDTLVYRHDQCGVRGYHLWLGCEEVDSFWQALVPDDPTQARAKPLGWLAFNMARLEAGQPLFHVDFGPDSLPGETALLAEAVSFTKGCYRGQEIVATMKDRGHPAKLLVKWKARGEALPVAGSPVYTDTNADEAIGAVTSSTPSPLLSSTPIGLAMVKWGHHEAGANLFAAAEGGRIAVDVIDGPFV